MLHLFAFYYVYMIRATKNTFNDLKNIFLSMFINISFYHMQFAASLKSNITVINT